MKKLYFFFILIIPFSQIKTAHAETFIQNIEDSLLNTINTKGDIETIIDKYQVIIKFYQNNNFEKSIEFSDRALALCQQHKLKNKSIEIKIEKARCYILSGYFDEGSELIFAIEQDLLHNKNDILTGKLFLLKSMAFINLGEFAKAMDNALKSIIYFNKTDYKLGLAKSYNNIGLIYDVTNNNHKALENYLKSKQYGSELNDLSLAATLDNNIGVIYDKLNDSEKALSYYYKALEYYNSAGNLLGSSTSFNNIASILSELERYHEAMIYYNKALEISIATQNQTNMALLKYNIGALHENLNNLDSAEANLLECIDLCKKTNDAYSLAETYNLLADIYVKQQRLKEAKEMLHEAINLSQQTGVLLLLEEGLKSLSQIYASQHNYKSAFQYQSQATLMADSLRESIKNEELKYSDFQIEFQNQSTLFEKDLKRTQEQHQKELRKQKTEKYTYALLLVLIVSITLILYRSFSKSSLINKKLLQKNREVEDQKELMEISNLELWEQYTFTETLLNTIPNPVFYTDKNSHLLGCNKAFEELTGMPLDKLVGLNINLLHFNFDISCDATKIFKENNKKLIRKEGILTYNDGVDHDVICYRKGIIDDKEKLRGVLGIIIDITDIRQTERKLKYSQTRLKEVINAKDKFFNIMAHDLKNPFNAILGLTTLITDNYENHSEVEIKEYIALINESSHQIYSLLENILEWARAQSGSIEKNPSVFLINEAIQNCINLFNHSLNQKNITVSIDIQKDFEVKADKNMIMTILRNLLSNAIKYTDKHGQIDIDVSLISKFLKVSISDNGVGIKPENIKRLFKIDQPISTLGIGNEKGTGLGLIICQEFVKQNGGTIGVSSKPGKGSTFTFTIPTE